MHISSFNHVSKRAPRNATGMMKEAPHVGPSWRPAEICEYLLSRKIITGDDISHQISPNSKLHQDVSTESLDNIDEWWGQIEDPKTTQNPTKKLAINSMIGLMAKHTNTLYTCKMNEPGWGDTLSKGTKRIILLKEFGLDQVVMQFEQVTKASMVPIHLPSWTPRSPYWLGCADTHDYSRLDDAQH
ncbi:hypothetical protein N9L68_03385 [bacterium]|nr:hypothetical protein [bacterium]